MFLDNRIAPSTIIHRLHPFSKMAVGLCFSGFALCLKNPLALSALLGFMLAVLVTARVHLTLRQWVSVFLFLSIISLLNFWASEDTTHAATYSLRFAVFLTAMPILAATTDPQHMAQALSRTPLPTGMSMALLLVWRFFPVMANELRQMRRAALLRGAICDGVSKRIYRGLLIPLSFCVIEYTDRITLALELRGFTPAKQRTCYRQPKAGFADLTFVLAAVFAVIVAAWLQWGAGR